MEERGVALKANYRYMKTDILSKLKLSIKKTLVSGSTSDVYVAKYKTHPKTTVVAKIFRLSDVRKKKREKRLKTFVQESSIHKELKHDNIVLFIHSFLCPKYAVILSEYCPTGSLYEHFKEELTVVQVRRFFVQISNALVYMHEKRIVHRDVKHQNVLMKGKDVYLTDFGLSKRLREGDDMLASFAGTPEYMAPEVYNNYAIATEYDAFKADSFAMGVLLWCMIMKEDREEGDLSLCRMIQPKRDLFPVLTDCAIQLLQADPVARKSVSHVMADLNSRGFDFINHPERIVQQQNEEIQQQQQQQQQPETMN